MVWIRRGGWEDLLSRAKAGETLRVALPDGMGTLVVVFIEGSQDAGAWVEPSTDIGQVALLGLDGARSLMRGLPDELEGLWQRHYDGRQTREHEFLDALQRVSSFVSQPFPLPDWLQEE